MKPYQSEYTGYMGNWGGTKDRWYRRAAIVMWTRERSFAAQAEASGLWALGELRRLADAGDLAAARAAASSVSRSGGFRVGAAAGFRAEPECRRGPGRAGDGHDAAPAVLCGDADPRSRGALLALAGHYGPEWMGGMLAVWFGERSRAYHDAELRRPEWLASLPGLCEALGGEDGVTRGLLDRVVALAQRPDPVLARLPGCQHPGGVSRQTGQSAGGPAGSHRRGRRDRPAG